MWSKRSNNNNRGGAKSHGGDKSNSRSAPHGGGQFKFFGSHLRTSKDLIDFHRFELNFKGLLLKKNIAHIIEQENMPVEDWINPNPKPGDLLDIPGESIDDKTKALRKHYELLNEYEAKTYASWNVENNKRKKQHQENISLAHGLLLQSLGGTALQDAHIFIDANKRISSSGRCNNYVRAAILKLEEKYFKLTTEGIAETKDAYNAIKINENDQPAYIIEKLSLYRSVINKAAKIDSSNPLPEISYGQFLRDIARKLPLLESYLSVRNHINVSLDKLRRMNVIIPEHLSTSSSLHQSDIDIGDNFDESDDDVPDTIKELSEFKHRKLLVANKEINSLSSLRNDRNSTAMDIERLKKLLDDKEKYCNEQIKQTQALEKDISSNLNKITAPLSTRATKQEEANMLSEIASAGTDTVKVMEIIRQHYDTLEIRATQVTRTAADEINNILNTSSSTSAAPTTPSAISKTMSISTSVPSVSVSTPPSASTPILQPSTKEEIMMQHMSSMLNNMNQTIQNMASDKHHMESEMKLLRQEIEKTKLENSSILSEDTQIKELLQGLSLDYILQLLHTAFELNYKLKSKQCKELC